MGTVNFALPVDIPMDFVPPSGAPGSTVTCGLWSESNGSDSGTGCMVVDGVFDQWGQMTSDVPDVWGDFIDANFTPFMETYSGILYYDIGGLTQAPNGVNTRITSNGNTAFLGNFCGVTGHRISIERPATVYVPCVTNSMLIAADDGYDAIFPGLRVFYGGAAGVDQDQFNGTPDAHLIISSEFSYTATPGNYTRNDYRAFTFRLGDGSFNFGTNYWDVVFDRSPLCSRSAALASSSFDMDVLQGRTPPEEAWWLAYC